MHQLRRQAHKLAWEPGSMNPFVKLSRPVRHTDEEAGGHLRTQSEPVDAFNTGTNERPHLEKARSVPPISAGAGQEILQDIAEERRSGNTATTGTSDTVANDRMSETSAEGSNIQGPRKRKSNSGDNNDEERTEVDLPMSTPAPEGNEHKFTVASQLRATILNSWINVLLIAVPVGIALANIDVNPLAIFIVNFVAIIPLAAMLSYATEEIALRTGETIGGLLNASFGNAVELIVAIIALVKGELTIVQTSLIGSMLSNLLLVMGMCFFFGGLNRLEQHFNITVAQTAASLLILAVGSLVIPTAFVSWSSAGKKGVLELSRGTSIMLLITYGCYLFFQLKSHISMYNTPSEKVAKRSTKVDKGDASKGVAQIGAAMSKMSGGEAAKQELMQNPDDEEEEPQLAFWVAILTLCISTALVGVTAEYMVDSIDAVTDEYNISEEFVGLILLPIVGNAAEHATAVTVAVKDKMDLAIGVAIGSSMQIAMLVIPIAVVLGWILTGSDLTLDFDGFQIAILFVAALLVNFIISDGKSHWLEGAMLQILYVIIAVAAWFYPAKGDAA
ncbi:MAG: hypothetical protein M1834_001540 [Cirrosporium novae-zelandiae]|nr:MAG: hypothetical protein M1834_004057 [Cirrosporium novae-zelandiae]KAI9735525.1 MAG: hypothetical protein M1834_001540 [Cirrosporium novae-zelandiae]